MADETNITDTKTRANLAYIWSVGAIAMLAYILYMWGSQKEILTLIIGLLGGTILGGIFGVYFGGSTTAKKPDNTTPVTGDNTTVVNNPPVAP